VSPRVRTPSQPMSFEASECREKPPPSSGCTAAHPWTHVQRCGGRRTVDVSPRLRAAIQRRPMAENAAHIIHGQPVTPLLATPLRTLGLTSTARRGILLVRLLRPAARDRLPVRVGRRNARGSLFEVVGTGHSTFRLTVLAHGTFYFSVDRHGIGP